MRHFPNLSQTILGSVAGAVRDAFIPPMRVQFAALPYRQDDNGLEYLLVTSRDTGRWIVPKGWPTSDGNAVDAVSMEAWEEAGIRGEVRPTAVGEYIYRKRLDAGHEIDCRVVVHPLAVKYLAKKFPEAGMRKREWVKPEQAAKRVDEPELRAILLAAKRSGVLSLT